MAPTSRADPLRDLHAGAALHREGRLARAEALYRKVLTRQPDQPDALNLLGVIAQDQGRPVRAVQLHSRALRARPNFPEALVNLARAQRAAGDLDGAITSARHAIALAPRLAEGHVQLGRALLDAGDHAAAAEACRAAIGLAPHSLDAHVNLGAALTRLKEWSGAAKAYQVAHKLKPDRAETLVDFGVALREQQLLDEARQCHARAVALAPNDVAAHAAYATTLKQVQDVEGSAAACRRALKIAPERTDIWIMLGGNLAALGQFDAAADAYRQALAQTPDSSEARRGLVAAGKLTGDVAELDRLRALADDPTQPAAPSVSANFALGSLYDKAGKYDLAFRRYEEANRVARQIRAAEGQVFDPGALANRVDALIAAWTPDTFAAVRDWGEPSELPVFIVGMPRSGTTLTEQIAAGHSHVFGAGELPDLSRITIGLERGGGGPAPTSWGKDAVRREAATHLATLNALGDGAERVIDKMPDNLFCLGTIATLFPRARIVLCRRDLRDVCLSCFMQHFNAGMTWTHDLRDLAARTRETERLVAHWRRVLPLPLLEISYEALVQDLKEQSRRLIDFLGLQWDPACLSFHEVVRPVLTASLWQVRQPLYTSSVGRWRRYQTHLQPLLDGLAGLVPEMAEQAVGASDPNDTGAD